MTLQEQLARRIRELTAERKIPLSRLAEGSGLSKNTINNVINANTNMSMYTLFQITDYLGIGLGELFPEEEKTPLPKNEEERNALERYQSLEPQKKACADGYLYAMLESNEGNADESVS